MRVIREIATGGYGRVEEVTHGGKRYARKTFDESLQPQMTGEQRQTARRRFIREVTIQAQLDHPHLVPILEHDLDEDPPWFLMPLAQESFGVKIERDRLTGDVDLDALLQILAGLEELHRLGYVHRDLKPANVLLVGDRWMLSDLGLILPITGITTTLTGLGSAYGTMWYAAPEQAQNFHSAPPQADIYSFGCILHDIAGTTPRLPFAQATAPVPLGHIVERCTDKDPDERFHDVATLRSALVAMLSVPSSTTPAIPEVTDMLNRLASPEALSKDEWRGIIRFIDRDRGEQAWLLIGALDIPQIDAANAVSPGIMAQLAVHISRWVRDGGFDFPYCDVLAARLQRLYDLGDVRQKAEATMAALAMGCSHNRWYVMRTFMRMAGKNIDEDLADRLVVEMCSLGIAAVYRMNHVERAIGATRAGLHRKVREAINKLEPAAQQALTDTIELS